MSSSNLSRQSSSWVGWRSGAMLIFVAAMLIAGCSGGSTGTTTQKPACYENKPELRYWARDILAIPLRLPPKLGVSDAAISAAVASQLRPILKEQRLGDIEGISTDQSTSQSSLPFIRIGQNAIAFYRLSSNSDSGLASVCDQRLVGAINSINGRLKSSPGGDSQAGVKLQPIPVQVGSNAADVVSIVGASPDWTFAGSSVGDSGGGRPGGPPRLLPSGASPSSAVDGIALQSPNGGEGTTVVVLDTGYSMQGNAGAHASLIPCPGASSALCAPKSVPITFNGDVKNAISSHPDTPPFAGLGTPDDAGQYPLEESDATVQTDTPDPAGGGSLTAPPYEFLDAASPQQPVNVVDHGLFISGQIHAAAPKAQIRLVRVLNDYGIGDLRSILVGLQTAANHPDVLHINPKSNVVVNLSLGFGPPANCLVGAWDRWQSIQATEDDYVKKNEGKPYPFDCLKEVRQNASGLVGSHAGLTLPISFLLSDLTNPATNRLRIEQGLPPIRAVVAASGNESRGYSPPLDADLPAAICGVIPVAAMTATGALADFSNSQNLSGNMCLSVTHTDDPNGNPTSVTVSLAPRSGPALIAQGVNACGIFLQKVPPAILTPGGSPNPTAPAPTTPTNLALWDGTSFASGFASGYIAREGAAPPSGKVPDRQPCNTLGG